MTREINLLPPDRRRTLEQESYLQALQKLGRNFLLSLWLVTAAGVVALVTLRSLAVAEERNQYFNVVERVEEFRMLRDMIALDNEKLKVMLEQIEGRIVWSSRVQELMDTLPPGVRVSRLLATDQPPNRQIVFSGTAVTRNALIVLEKRLQSLDWIERVEAPVSNLINRTDAEYIFTVRIKAPDMEIPEASADVLNP